MTTHPPTDIPDVGLYRPTVTEDARDKFLKRLRAEKFSPCLLYHDDRTRRILVAYGGEIGEQDVEGGGIEGDTAHVIADLITDLAFLAEANYGDVDFVVKIIESAKEAYLSDRPDDIVDPQHTKEPTS